MTEDAKRLRALILDYQAVFRSEAGLNVIRDLMRHFGYTRKSTYVPGDRSRSDINEGQRTVLIHIGRHLDANPADIPDDYDLEEDDDPATSV